MRLIDRIFEYMNHRRLSPYQFERECGIANGYLQKQNKGKGTIGSEILEKIHDKYQDLSIEWLITGKGKMLSDDMYNVALKSLKLSEEPQTYTSEETLKSLREKVAILENALADKEKIIKLLEERLRKD